MNKIKIGIYEVTEPVNCLSYQFAVKCPRGFRLPTQWELFRIFGETLENPLRRDVYVGFYWSSTLGLNKDYCKGIILSGGLEVFSDGSNLASSNSAGKVIYIKEKK